LKTPPTLFYDKLILKIIHIPEKSQKGGIRKNEEGVD
jgi:hypothetical protein